ncbi:MAG: 2-hydroxychromene-2-carboxylate isomerase [Polyangiales bacterium]
MKTVDFYFDLSSPYSYLAATQIPALAARRGADVQWKPIVLAAVFKAADNHMPAQSPPKARYMVNDLDRWAKKYGVPFVMNSRFPLNTIKPERLVIAAEPTGRSKELALALFSAMWAEDKDISSVDEMRAAARSVGLDSDALLAAIETAPVKDKLRAYTDEAIAREAFGAPSFVYRGELYWGNDRMEFLEDALRA